MSKTLVVIPCGQSKVWDKNPSLGPTPAGRCYTGAPFKVNKEYAEKFSDSWVILSAKYGFIRPDFIVPESYNVTFKKKLTNPIPVGKLRRQVVEMGLINYDIVVGLGGKEYRQMIQQSFAGTDVVTEFPFAGLPIGKAMQALRRSIINGNMHARY